MSEPVFAVVAGGGTAGHVLPGVAVTRELEGRGRRVHYVGAARGIEARLLPGEGIDHTLLPGRGIQRRLTFANVAAIVGIVRGVVTSIGLVRTLRPKVVLALGGYASFPCVVAAILWRVPIIVAEQNVVPGVANRFAARWAKASAVSFPGTPLPRAVVTGNPIRPVVLGVDRSAAGMALAREELGLPLDRRVVLVAGGSLGARSINETTVALARAWSGRSTVAIRHVVGDRDWEVISAAAPTSAAPTPTQGQLVYQQLAYEDRMATALAAADVGVFRSGSSMCFEVAAVGLPSVLVPSPHVAGDHQTANARWLAEAGGAVVVADADLTAERLGAEVDALLDDPARRDAMVEVLHRLAKPHAAATIADLMEHHARA